MKLKRVLAMAMTATMMAGCLAGCGNKTATTSNGGAGNDDFAGATIKVHFHSNNKYTIADANGAILPVFQLASDKTKVTVVNAANPVAQDSKQEFELQATEKFPADIYGGTGLKQSITSYGVQGAFLPMNDLIDKYAPNIKKFFEQNPDIKKAETAADGNIYMLNYCPDGDVGRTFFIRQDWLDTLGMSMPTTFDDLEKVLYAFRNNDPNGNGLKDEVPVFNDKWQESIRLANLWGARVYGFDTFDERVVLNKNDKFYHAWTAPEFKNALIGLHKWYQDGILDPEMFSRKTNTAKQTLFTKENTGGMTHDFFASLSAYNYNTELLASVPNFKLKAMLPVSAVGAPFEEHHRAIAKVDGWAISAQTTNPEACIRYMDWFYSEEGRRAINFGIEGDSYTMVNGEPVFTEKILSQTNVNTYIQQNYGAQYPIGYKQNYAYEKQWVCKEGQEAYDMYAKDKDKLYTAKPTPVLNYNESEQEVYDKYLTPLNTYMDEMVTGFITGKNDINAEWDSYVAKCKDLGSEELVKIYDSAYARYKTMK